MRRESVATILSYLRLAALAGQLVAIALRVRAVRRAPVGA